MLVLILWNSLKALGIVVFLLVVYDLFSAGVLLDLFSTLLSPPAGAKIDISFHVIYIISGLLIAAVTSSLIGLVWALSSTVASGKDKTRATLVCLFLLASAAISHISRSSIEMEQSGSDFETLQSTVLGEGKLRVTGRLKNNLYGVSRVESVEYQDEYGVPEIIIHVYAKAADGRRPSTFDHTLDLPEYVGRVLVGNSGDRELVWGLSAEKLLAEAGSLQDKLTPVTHEYLWRDARTHPKDPSSQEWWDDRWLCLEIRRIHLNHREPGAGFLEPYRTKIDQDHVIYKNRISGKVKAMRFDFDDGSSIIIDNESDPTLMDGTNLIICEPDGTMNLYSFKKDDKASELSP
jgi:hypothetical protein